MPSTVAAGATLTFAGRNSDQPDGPYAIWTNIEAGPVVVESVYCAVLSVLSQLTDVFVLYVVEKSGAVLFAQASQLLKTEAGNATAELTWARGGAAVDADSYVELELSNPIGAAWLAQTMPLGNMAIAPGSYVTLTRRPGFSPNDDIAVGPVVVTYTPATAEGAAIVMQVVDPVLVRQGG